MNSKSNLSKFIKESIKNEDITHEYSKILMEELQKYIQDRLKKYKRPHSDETKKKISEALINKPSPRKGKITVYHKNEKYGKMINPDQLNEFVSNGWTTKRVVK